MGINHRCLNLCVPQNFLERQNIAAVHHEMTGEGVAQRMNSLAVRNIRCDRFDDIANQWIPDRTSEFSAMGDVTALSTEDITEGPLAGRTALYAEIEPTERMKQLVADGKKIYSSIELHPQFSVNGRAYLVGLAMTDTPASLGTERLKFTAQQRQAVMTFNSVQGEAPLISEAIESEIIEMAEQRQEEGTQWFNRVMGIIGRGRKADDASFSRIQEAVEGVATSQADIIDRFNVLETRHQQDRQKITSLTTELTALKEKLRTQDGDPQNRFTATGAASDQLADF